MFIQPVRLSQQPFCAIAPRGIPHFFTYHQSQSGMQKIVRYDIKYDLVVYEYRTFIKDPFEFFLSGKVFGFCKLETHFYRLAEGRNEVNGMRKKTP
jgi:hypothetical protein